jgi:hypothetical protein
LIIEIRNRHPAENAMPISKRYVRPDPEGYPFIAGFGFPFSLKGMKRLVYYGRRQQWPALFPLICKNDECGS